MAGGGRSRSGDKKEGPEGEREKAVVMNAARKRHYNIALTRL